MPMSTLRIAGKIRAQGGHVKARGTIYLSNVRVVFVAAKPVGNFFAFDMPLVVPSIAVAFVSYEVVKDVLGVEIRISD